LVQEQDSSDEILGIIRGMVEMEAEWEREMGEMLPSFRRNMNQQHNRNLMASPHGEEIVEDIQ
jgi:hypothetical protein